MLLHDKCKTKEGSYEITETNSRLLAHPVRNQLKDNLWLDYCLICLTMPIYINKYADVRFILLHCVFMYLDRSYQCHVVFDKLSQYKEVIVCLIHVQLINLKQKQDHQCDWLKSMSRTILIITDWLKQSRWQDLFKSIKIGKCSVHKSVTNFHNLTI